MKKFGKINKIKKNNEIIKIDKIKSNELNESNESNETIETNETNETNEINTTNEINRTNESSKINKFNEFSEFSKFTELNEIDEFDQTNKTNKIKRTNKTDKTDKTNKTNKIKKEKLVKKKNINNFDCDDINNIKQVEDLTKKNNETFGMSVEKAICEIFNLESDDINDNRVDRQTINEIKDELQNYMNLKKMTATKYIGARNNQDDFIINVENENSLASDIKLLQVKTNFNNSDKVCPPKIGQCTKRTFKLNVVNKINNTIELNCSNDIKKFILENCKELIKLYVDAYYTSDVILHIQKKKNVYNFSTYNKLKQNEKLFDNCNFEFTRNIDNWNESNTVKIIYKNIKYSIGEFQIHGNRDNVKFRFNRTNFHKLIDLLIIDE